MHDVEVKLKRPGLRVRHIEEYRDRTPREGAWEGRLSLFVAARDDSGRMSEITELLLPMRLKAPAAPGQPASYTTRMALRNAPHTIVLGIRDELGNTVSTVTAPYVPEARAAAAGERR